MQMTSARDLPQQVLKWSFLPRAIAAFLFRMIARNAASAIS